MVESLFQNFYKSSNHHYGINMYSARPIHTSDIELICDHRQRMFLEAGKDVNVTKAMLPPFKKWLESHLKNQTYYGFVVESETGPIGSVGLMTIDWPPHPEHPNEGHRGYVLNLYVESKHRKKEHAKNLMSLADTEFADRGVSFYILHPTTKARPLYESLGWQTSGEMTKSIR